MDLSECDAREGSVVTGRVIARDLGVLQPATKEVEQV